jgi:Ran-binding protein 1
MFFFSAYDCSEETPMVEKFVFKFGNAENAEKFRKAFNDCKEFNKLVKAGGEPVYAPVINDKDEEEEKEKKKDEEKKEDKAVAPAEEKK